MVSYPSLPPLSKLFFYAAAKNDRIGDRHERRRALRLASYRPTRAPRDARDGWKRSRAFGLNGRASPACLGNVSWILGSGHRLLSVTNSTNQIRGSSRRPFSIVSFWCAVLPHLRSGFYGTFFLARAQTLLTSFSSDRLSTYHMHDRPRPFVPQAKWVQCPAPGKRSQEERPFHAQSLCTYGLNQ